MTVKLTLEYDGTRFSGWAAQPGLRTVQGELTRALNTLLRRDDVELACAGRTDTGVHALGQVASYEGEPPPRLRSLNALLPDDVGVYAVEELPDGFHARHDATARSYAYRLDTRRPGPSVFAFRRALWWPYAIDRDALDACAAALPGEHDFTAFTPTDTEHVRFERIVESAEWITTGAESLEFRITADAFMRNMNRALVGTMLDVAAGRRSVEDFAALLEGAHRRDGGPTAAAHGLYFVSAHYA
jgi:tRNA pseudouridine38-40 synthase